MWLWLGGRVLLLCSGGYSGGFDVGKDLWWVILFAIKVIEERRSVFGLVRIGVVLYKIRICVMSIDRNMISHSLFIVESSESLLITIVPRFDSNSTIVPLSGTNVPQSSWAIIVPPSIRWPSFPGTNVPESSGNSLIVRELSNWFWSSSSWKQIGLAKRRTNNHKAYRLLSVVLQLFGLIDGSLAKRLIFAYLVCLSYQII